LSSPVRNRRNRESGFTTIEALATIGISGIMIAAITSTFITQQKFYDSQEDITQMVQSTRNAMDLMTRELRMAGYSPTNVVFEGITPISATQVQIKVDLDGDGSTTGANETVTYSYDAANDRILRNDASIGNAESIAEDIDDVRIDYTNQFGASTTIGADVRELKITITGKTPKRTYVLTSSITPANLAYNVYTR
jgi:type IV pilus assembly protein PilW